MRTRIQANDGRRAELTVIVLLGIGVAAIAFRICRASSSTWQKRPVKVKLWWHPRAQADGWRGRLRCNIPFHINRADGRQP
jgi:hypothetical protein